MAALVSNAGSFFTSSEEGTTPPVKVSDGAQAKGKVVASPEKLDDGPLGLMGFVRWVVSLQNRLIVSWVKEEQEERKAFKAQEDAKFWERKQELHKQTQDEFGNAKKQVAAVVQSNLAKGAEYKEELDLMKEQISNDREEWALHGHLLTIKHGSEQAERNRVEKAEMAFHKAELGRQVKQEAQELRNRSAAERQADLQHARSHVKELKHEKEGKVEESLQYAFNQKKAIVSDVKQTEEEWRKMTAVQRKRFNEHAKMNHQLNDATKEHMRQARVGLIEKNHGVVQSERKVKMEKATEIVKTRSQNLNAKRLLRDALYSQRFVSPDKKRIVERASRAASPEKIALDAGLIEQPTLPKTVSPYKMPISPYWNKSLSPQGSKGPKSPKSPSKAKSPSVAKV